MSTYSVHLASPSEYKEALALRIHVFVDIQKFPLDEEIDEYDPLAQHFVITHVERANKVVGTLRVYTTGENAKIGRVAVLPEYQGQGLGKRLIEHLEIHLQQDAAFKQCKEAKLGSQYDKRVFYEKCGFVARGDIYDELGCPHIYMYKPINHVE
ncbi:Acetyltransferase (GNAT) domain [Coemansia sp. RSA 1972]|nr:Acetyltransferase (GNAT) domain [Coemansia sp. RSA 1972]